jgi:UDP-N-acetylmuramoylalanine--D-glutamate ligase
MPSKQSVQAAFLLCKRCGVTDIDFLKGLQTYKKPPHRIEWVAEINGVAYYNDSKSSNIHSVMHAVDRFEGPLVLLIGGLHKGSSYKPWIDCFRGKVSKIIAYGQAGPLMELELGAVFPFEKIDRFSDAVKAVKKEAKKGETVLLSPGCSSYDQFESYEHRGEEFKRLVREKNE